MKKITGYFTVFILLNTIHLNVFSQTTETEQAKISASVLEAGSIAKTINTDFGNVAIILSAFVKMAPVGTKPAKGGIILPVSSGTFTAAIYDYTGSQGLTYSISYPTTPFIVRSGSDALQVDSFTSDPARNSGSELIAGIFVSVTPSNVTVNYN